MQGLSFDVASYYCAVKGYRAVYLGTFEDYVAIYPATIQPYFCGNFGPGQVDVSMNSCAGYSEPMGRKVVCPGLVSQNVNHEAWADRSTRVLNTFGWPGYVAPCLKVCDLPSADLCPSPAFGRVAIVDGACAKPLPDMPKMRATIHHAATIALSVPPCRHISLVARQNIASLGRDVFCRWTFLVLILVPASLLCGVGQHGILR